MVIRQLLVDVRSRARLLAAVVLGFFLLLPAVNIFGVFVGGGTQVSYAFRLVANTCRIQSAPCLTYAELQLGNTGSRDQDRIEIELTNLPPWSAADHYSVRIVASSDPFVFPVVSADPGQQRITVERLAANQMVTFQFVIPGSVTRDEFEAASPRIQAAGRVIESSPKATALARAFRMAFAFLL